MIAGAEPVKIKDSLSTASPTNLADIAWAFSTAGVHGYLFYDALVAEISKKAPAFTAKELAQTVKALSMAIVVKQKEAYTLDAKHLGDAAWAFAKAKIDAQDLFKAVSLASIPKIQDFQAEDLSNVSWALATMGVDAPLLFEAVASEAAKKMDTFSAKQLSSTLWAVARAGVEAPDLFEKANAEAPRHLKRCNSRDLVHIVWA
ncbi:hypothetical protein M885DRAFT_562238 [Pelagophyceae sp. CCMP2097]|nr:hypothetical protein M885DRAFT_562238 [Pelagophyceae sp. CCMP2097]